MTLARQGFRMPAEWEPHAATWLSYPRRECHSFLTQFNGIPDVWLAICQHLVPHEEVHLNYFDEDHRHELEGVLKRGGISGNPTIHLHPFPAYEPWCRDHGPIFVKRPHPPGLAVVDWDFNAWGLKYPSFDLDDEVPARSARHLHLPLIRPGLILEGGSIDVNGCGSLLTTESCLLNRNRNPHLSKREIEQALCDHLGATNILWLGKGISGDDTDGHVDDLSRFVAPDTIVTIVEEDPTDINHAVLQDNLRRLRSMKDQDGKPFRIVTLPMPGVFVREGRRLPASYANFYIANNVVLMPAYQHPNDAKAQRILQELFPKRKVIPVDCRQLIWGRGAIHCITQQQPSLP